jgi:hypothetical protein
MEKALRFFFTWKLARKKYKRELARLRALSHEGFGEEWNAENRTKLRHKHGLYSDGSRAGELGN